MMELFRLDVLQQPSIQFYFGERDAQLVGHIRDELIFEPIELSETLVRFGQFVRAFGHALFERFLCSGPIQGVGRNVRNRREPAQFIVDKSIRGTMADPERTKGQAILQQRHAHDRSHVIKLLDVDEALIISRARTDEWSARAYDLVRDTRASRHPLSDPAGPIADGHRIHDVAVELRRRASAALSRFMIWTICCKMAGIISARRANIKFKREMGAKAEYVHTLNGSGLALPLVMIAVLENYQRADDSVIVPECCARIWAAGT